MVTLEILTRVATPGRRERGDTHVMYCYWDMNDTSYKVTIGCNPSNFHAKLHELVGRATCSATKKGASSVSLSILNLPEGFNQ